MAFTSLAVLHEQRRIDQLLAVLPVTNDKSEVILLYLPVPKTRVQLAKRTAPFGHDEATGRFTIDAMHQCKILEIRASMAQQLDHSVADAAAPVNGNTRRLVDDEQALVLIEHPLEHAGRQLFGRRWSTAANPRRRHTDLVAFL
jgi:hypothetical protein